MSPTAPALSAPCGPRYEDDGGMEPGERPVETQPQEKEPVAQIAKGFTLTFTQGLCAWAGEKLKLKDL